MRNLKWPKPMYSETVCLEKDCKNGPIRKEGDKGGV